MKTIVLTNPIRFASDDAARFEMEEMIFVVKKRVPN